MTSTPVKDVGSLMNFVGNRAPVSSGRGVESADSFGSVMSKASENRQTPENTETVKDSVETVKETRVDKSHTRPETTKTEDDTKRVKDVKSPETEEAVQEAVTEAGEQMVKEIAQTLGVSEEEILDAMEELGFGMAALLNPDNLTQLVLTLSGGDSVSLLTDAGLYDSLQTLLQSQQEIMTNLSEEFLLSAEDFNQLLEEMNVPEELSDVQMGQVQEPASDIPNQDAEDNAKITVTVEEGTQSVKMTTDENGNVKQVETVAFKDAQEQSTDGEETAQQQGSSEEGNEMMGAANPLLNNVTQGNIAPAEVSFEQAAAYFTADTENIMNQIMDYMKIQLSPQMDQLEMQLHPESLGTVKIQLASQGGEVTAQFQVQNETVKAVIESQLVELKEALKNQGITVEAVEVSVESHAFESNLWQGQGREENASYQGNRKSPRRINLDSLTDGFEELETEEEILAAKMMEANGNTVDYTA